MTQSTSSSRKVSKRILDALKLYTELRLRQMQYRNIRIITNSPLPKKKSDHFHKLHAEYLVRERNALNAFQKATDQLSTDDKRMLGFLASKVNII